MQIISLGLVSYNEAYAVQRKYFDALVSESRSEEVLIFCEHTPVVTLGRGANASNVLLSKGALAAQGIELVESERGGDVTFHGPGQLVAYPILDLNLRKRDISWYMRLLEECIIRTIAHYGITGIRISGQAGVWLNEKLKIASLGVKLSRWKSMHGLALNVLKQPQFSVINPCGFADIQMTSIEELVPPSQKVSVKEVQELFSTIFVEQFERNVVEERCGQQKEISTNFKPEGVKRC